MNQGCASPSGVMHKLEKAQVRPAIPSLVRLAAGDPSLRDLLEISKERFLYHPGSNEAVEQRYKSNRFSPKRVIHPRINCTPLTSRRP